MIAWKFLGAARVGLYSGFSWPLGEWVEVSPPLVPSRRGVHACRVGDLPHWIDDELWTIELDELPARDEEGAHAPSSR